MNKTAELRIRNLTPSEYADILDIVGTAEVEEETTDSHGLLELIAVIATVGATAIAALQLWLSTRRDDPDRPITIQIVVAGSEDAPTIISVTGSDFEAIELAKHELADTD